MKRSLAILVALLLQLIFGQSSTLAYINGVGRAEWAKMTLAEKRAYERGGWKAVEKLRGPKETPAAKLARIAAEQEEAAWHAALSRLANNKETPADRDRLRSWRKERKPEAAPSVRVTVKPEELLTLITDLESRDDRARHHAAYRLRHAGEAGQPALPALIKTLADPDGDVRWVAAGTLGVIGGGSAEVRSALEGALRDPKPQVRRAAAESLANILP